MVSADRDSVALFAARLLSRAIGFLAIVYFARTVGSDGLGIYYTFQTVVSVAGVFTEFGVPGAVTKRMNQAAIDERRGTYLTGGFLLVAVPFALVSVVLFLFEPQLVGYVELAAAVPLLVLVLAIRMGNELLVGGLRGEARVATTAVVELTGQATKVAASVALLLAGFDAVGLVYGIAVGGAAQAAVATVMLRTEFGLPSAGTVRSLFDFSKYTVGMELSALAYNWADTLVLAAFAAKATVGVYETAWRLSAVALLAAQVIGISLAPQMTRWHEAGELERIESAFTTGVTFALVLVVPAVVGGLVLGDALLRTLYGFETGHVVLVVLLVGQLAQAFRNVTQNTLFGLDRPEHVFWTNVVTLGANVGLNLALVPRYGMIGAAAATLATASVAAASQALYTRRYIALSLDVRSVGWQVVVALGMGAVVYLLSSVVSPGSTLGLFLLVATGVAVYGAGILLNGSLRERLLRTAFR